MKIRYYYYTLLGFSFLILPHYGYAMMGSNEGEMYSCVDSACHPAKSQKTIIREIHDIDSAALPSTLFRVIGLMSGTSMDGIDVASIETDGYSAIKELGHTSVPYQREFHLLLKGAEYAVRKNNGNLGKVRGAELNEYLKDYLTLELKMGEEEASRQLRLAASYLHKDENQLILFDHVVDHSTWLHSLAVKNLLSETGYKENQIDLIGYHGQTLFHRPSSKITIQVGDGQKLADYVGIPVINDFRSNDVRNGGQGAPFAPLYHQALAVRDGRCPLAVVNCGGIANISIIAGPEHKDLLGYDTGPGNGLIDLYIKRHSHLKEAMDKDGQYGLKGKVNESVISLLYNKSTFKDGKNYFDVMPPKSLDINDLKLIPELEDLSPEDTCATLEAFTADSIVRSLDLIPSLKKPRFWVLAGGGWNNPVIKNGLIQRVKSNIGSDSVVVKAGEVGWNSKAMEAQIFAYLAVRSMQGRPISVPETTKVPTPLSGGRAYLPANGNRSQKIKKAIEANPAVLKGYEQ